MIAECRDPGIGNWEFVFWEFYFLNTISFTAFERDDVAGLYFVIAGWRDMGIGIWILEFYFLNTAIPELEFGFWNLLFGISFFSYSQYEKTIASCLPVVLLCMQHCCTGYHD